MAITEIKLSLSEQIKTIKKGGASDEKIDRKEEAMAILQFANKNLSNIIINKKEADLDNLVHAMKEADEYMKSNAVDISDEDRHNYKQDRKNEFLDELLKNYDNMKKMFDDFQKKLKQIKK